LKDCIVKKVNKITKKYFYKIIDRILLCKNKSTIKIKIVSCTKKFKKYNNILCLIQSDRISTIKEIT